MLNLIQESYRKEDALERAVVVSGLSDGYFRERFRAVFREPFHRFLIRYRLRQALGLIENTRMRMADIALEVGFHSHDTFLRAFKREFHVSPDEYRRDHRSSPSS